MRTVIHEKSVFRSKSEDSRWPGNKRPLAEHRPGSIEVGRFPDHADYRQSVTMSVPRSHDDDDSDVDDLDDVLDQFAPQSANKLPDNNDDFTTELARGMESLMRELDTSTTANEGEEKDGEREKNERFRVAWEAMLIEGMGASTSQPKPANTDQATTNPSTEFQSRIRNTMDKLKSSESNLEPSRTQEQVEVDELAKLLEGLGGEGADPNAEQELTDVLQAMMGQLMSKEVLYEPLKELYEKFPPYLESHPTLDSGMREQYQKQIACIKQLLEIFEAPTYNEVDPETNKKIMDVMSELQTHGSPPEDIVGSLPPGFSLGPDGLPESPDRCVVS